MPRSEMVVRVFVASPTDVTEERALLEEIVRELNLSWSRDLSARLELVRWETHATPGIGLDPQSVINDAIDADYDIFIGLLWARFGTPTGRAGSGTEEEFVRAHGRYGSDPSSLRIMFYFKDVPISPSQINPDQLTKVNAFRSQLGELGVLYWTYKDRDAFASLLRIHLTRQILQWVRDSRVGAENTWVNLPVIGEVVVDPDFIADDDVGMVDLMDESDEAMGRMAETLSRMVQELSQLTGKIESRTAEFTGLSIPGKEFDRGQFKRISKQTAEDMLNYTRRSETDLPIYTDAMKAAFDSLARAASLFRDLGPQHAEDLKETLLNVRAMRKQTIQAERAITGFRRSVVALPRLSTDINRAKRRMLVTVDGIVDALNTTEGLIGEVEEIIWDTLRDLDDDEEKEDEGGGVDDVKDGDPLGD
jgi:hypothetical protein